MSSHDTIKALREALRHSPDNVPLRLHLAQTLQAYGQHAEAEQELQAVLKQQPHNTEVKVQLADCFYQQSKNNHALVIIEDLQKKDQATPLAQLLYARLMIRAGDIPTAVAAYKEAIDLDESLEDEVLAEQLGIQAWTDASESNSEVVDGRARAAWGESAEQWSTEFEKPDIAFEDVGGMEDLKEEIRMKIIHPLTHPELYQAYGKNIGGGLLMYGPPGCGKTHLARATAGEVQASFLSIGIHDVLDMWIGQSERNLHELFENARANKPCVLFFDEVDALGASRSDMRQSGGRQLINQFLSELDGVSASNEGVLILAATNAPWHLDSAFRRPGRFDRLLFVPPPDAPARAEILEALLKGKPTKDIDYDYIAKKTTEFSGADLKAVVDQAVEAKLREAMSKGKPTPLTTSDLKSATKKLKPTTKEWFSTARNHALYANQGGIYDDILHYLKIKK